MISTTGLVILALSAVLSCSQMCETPQKSFYMSYNAISNHDYLSDMFDNVSLSLPQYNLTYTDKNGSVYSLINFKPHLYYNEHRQVEAYVGTLFINIRSIDCQCHVRTVDHVVSL
jgi:hypothetical protein